MTEIFRKTSTFVILFGMWEIPYSLKFDARLAPEQIPNRLFLDLCLLSRHLG